ncbi:MAG TPA: hypothetical protein VKV77_00785 [Methylovirgula sp.]|nr:hypothetical protein [Methylovirgula sp.]
MRSAAQGFARPRPRGIPFVDKVIVSGGICAAVVSASFATYMVSTDHPHPMFGGIEHLMIFAEPNNYGRRPASEQADIDYTATGAIPAKPSVQASDLPEPIIGTYVLREAQDGAAIVVAGDDVYRIRRGSLLPGVGEVLAIEKRRDKWVVVTPRGLITDGSP